MRCVFLFVFVSTGLTSQTVVQWASRVVDFSSEYSGIQNSAAQVLGKPNILPSGGEGNPNAWSPFTNNTVEYITVQFDLPMPIAQIAIGETDNPGAVRKVVAYDENDKAYMVYKETPAPVKVPYRMFRIFMRRTPYHVKALKVVVDGRAVNGFVAIDCIGVSNSSEPIQAKINLMPNINPGLLVHRLSDRVNSPNREIKPLLTRDKMTLYFSRRWHPGNVGGEKDMEDIWFSDFDKKAQQWGTAGNIGEPLNNSTPNFISSFLREGDEDLIILGNEYLKEGMHNGISKSRRTSDSTWTYPESLHIFNDLNENENVNFWLTPDGQVLIISEEGRDTEGYRDLYVSFLQKNGVWTEPLHTGSTINTAGEEEAPYLMPDKKTLFFTSNGHSGYGKKDIFMTRRLDHSWKRWTEPENLGPMINTELDDMFFFLPSDGSFGYFCREIEGNDLDIHAFTLPLIAKQDRMVSLRGEMTDPDTRQPLGDVEVLFSRLRDGEEAGRVRTDAGGNYSIELPTGEIYSYRAEIPGFIPMTSTVDLLDVPEPHVVDSADPAQNIMRSVSITLATPKLKRDEMLNAKRQAPAHTVQSSATTERVAPTKANARVASGKHFVTSTLALFDFNKDVLKQQNWIDIRNLANFMKDYPKAVVQLAGHTDAHEHDKSLSERRVKAVKKALADWGIKEDRLELVWQGKEVPVASNSTRKGRNLNRRVEFTILSR